MSASDWFFDVEPIRRWDDDMAWAKQHFGGEPLDPGIVRVVRIFKDAGIETCQSCEGPDGMQPEGRYGVGHSYRDPTVDIYGEPWKALDVANAFGIRVDQISEIFGVTEGRPIEHFWRIEFNSLALAALRQEWYRPVTPYFKKRISRLDADCRTVEYEDGSKVVDPSLWAEVAGQDYQLVFDDATVGPAMTWAQAIDIVARRHCLVKQPTRIERRQAFCVGERSL